MTREKKTKKISLRVSETVYAQLLEESELLDMSISKVLCMYVEEYERLGRLLDVLKQMENE